MATQAITVDTLPSYNPATGEVVEEIPRTNPNEIPAIVARAKSAQEKWREMSIADRCALLNRLKQTMLAGRNDLAAIVVRESGKPHVEALFSDVFVSLDTAAYYSANLAKLQKARDKESARLKGWR